MSTRRDPITVAGAVRRGDRLALARLLTWVELGDERADEVQLALEAGPPTAPEGVAGVTGPPGAGKSTLVNSLVRRLRGEGRTVGVVAVDPSSAATGGALLGDRVRMAHHLTDQGVFIRSMANRGQFGGLAAAVPGAIRALTSFGFDWVLVETVGVGQVEIDIARHADCTVLLAAPGGGDDVQAVKAGVMEIADILVVNKCDLPGAEATARALTAAVRLRRTPAGTWRPPVVSTDAERGVGVDELLGAVRAHLAHIRADGTLDRRRRDRRVHEWRASLLRRFGQVTDEMCTGGLQARLRAEVMNGDVMPQRAASRVAASVRELLLLDT